MSSQEFTLDLLPTTSFNKVEANRIYDMLKLLLPRVELKEARTARRLYVAKVVGKRGK